MKWTISFFMHSFDRKSGLQKHPFSQNSQITLFDGILQYKIKIFGVNLFSFSDNFLLELLCMSMCYFSIWNSRWSTKQFQRNNLVNKRLFFNKVYFPGKLYLTPRQDVFAFAKFEFLEIYLFCLSVEGSHILNAKQDVEKVYCEIYSSVFLW